MFKAITNKLLVIILLSFSVKLNAQQWLGRTTGNYSGTYGLYNNASSIADSKYRYYFNIWGSGANFYNNYLLYKAPISTTEWGMGKNEPDFMDLNGKSKYYSFNQDIWGPAFMFPISKKVNMSINMRQRSSVQYFGVSEPVARMVYNGTDSNSSIYSGDNALNMNTYYHNGKFGSNVQSNRELSVSFAGILAKNEHHQLTGGATLKLIQGLGAAYLKGDGFDVASTGNNAIQLQNADIQYAYTDTKSVMEPLNKPYSLFSLNPKGFGAGVDLGLTYTYTAQKGKYATDKYCNNTTVKSDYDIKIAAAFNDIGGIRFNNGATKYSYSNANTANIIAPANTFKNPDLQTQNTFDSIGKYVFEPIGANKSGKFNTTLPTAFNFQADFRLADHFYTAVYLNQSLKGINTTGMKSTSLLSIIPRVETRLVEVSMPLTLSENYKNFYIGAYLRVGPVFIGSDNLGGLLKVASKTPFRGADIYGGVSFGLDQCNRWFYDYLVEPTYIDTVKQKDPIVKKDSVLKKDTVKTEKKDTIKIIKHDTIRIFKHDTVIINKKGATIHKTIHDTLYIEKVVKSKIDLQKENELKKREADIIIRQKELDAREKLFGQKEKVTNNDSAAIKKCNEYNAILYAENTKLKKDATTQSDEIIRLQKKIDSLNKINTNNNTTIIKLTADKTKVEKDAKNASKKADSLQAQLDNITIVLNNCKKGNNGQDNTEIIKLKADKSKAENDVKAANKKADSLQAQLDIIIIDLNNCKKNNNGQDNTEIIKLKADKSKAEKDAEAAGKKADSLQLKLNGVTLDLTDCKKSNTQNDVYIVKLKKAEDDKNLYKTELDAANKTNFDLNGKLYKRNATIDSLINELAKCGNNSNDENALLLKKCNDSKTEMTLELNRLKKNIDATDKSLDSTTAIVVNLRKGKTLLEKQIEELTSDLKNKNCDTFEIQIQQKNKTINDINIQNTTLQNKINTLTIQLNQSKIEYQAVNKQNQECNKKLDSCMRGLNQKVIDEIAPKDDKGIDNGKSGGPMEGSTNDQIDAKFDKHIFDFGSVTEGDKVKINFVLTNTGTLPISILSHTVSCGCTEPTYSKAPILPGESTTVSVAFNSDGKSGAQNKTLSITTTAGTELLTIQGNVIEKDNEFAINGIDTETGTLSNKIQKGTILLNVLSAIVKAAVAGSNADIPSTSPSTPAPTGNNKTNTETNTGTTKTNTETPVGRNSAGTNTNSSTRRR